MRIKTAWMALILVLSSLHRGEAWTSSDVRVVLASMRTASRRPHSKLSWAGTNDNYEGNETPRSWQNRRQSLNAMLSITTTAVVSGGDFTISTQAAYASQQVRAPVELLRPASRVKLYIDEAVKIASCSRNSSDGTAASANQTTLQALSEFLAKAPQFMTAEEEQLSRRYLEIDTSTAWQNARRKEREAKGAALGIDYTTPYDQINTAIQQWGDRRQFQILRSRQLNLERANTMRAALNAYTNNLVFGDAYQLNVQGDVKKALVRNDALPNVNSVVVSDLDLRDLVRNQILQNMDDARAELSYQLESGDVDIGEILKYLRQAQDSCREWFSFIPPADVEEALTAVNGSYSVSY